MPPTKNLAPSYRQSVNRIALPVVYAFATFRVQQNQQIMHRDYEFPLTSLTMSLRCGRKWKKVVSSRVE